MNYSDYSLHGISPFYDQTIFVRCHLCRNIVKLPQLADHLDKRHQNVNNGKISKDTLQVNTNEQFDSTALHNHYSSSEIQNNGSSAKKGRKSNSFNSDSLKQNESKSKIAQLTKNRNKANRNLNESLTAKNEINNEKQTNNSISIKENGNASTKSTNCNGSLNDSLTVAFPESFDNSNIENKINLACENLKINNTEKSDFDLKNVATVGSHIQTSSNNNINTNKLLPKIIIKKDKTSTNTQVFYLNNIQISSRPQQSQQDQNDSKINEKHNSVALSNEYKESNEMFKHYTNQSNLISPSSQSKGKSSCSTAIITKSFKSYDPNKHCGVIVETFDPVTEKKLTEEHCTRSLSCKKHSVSLRRQVIGRSKSFNELFKEQRNEKSIPSILSSSVGDNSSHKNNETINYDNVTTAAEQQQQIKTPRKNYKKKPSTSETLPLLNDANLVTDGLSHDQANQILSDKINYEKSHNNKNIFNHHHHNQNNTSLNNTLYTLNNHSEIFPNQMNIKYDIRHSSFIPPEQRFIANSLTPSNSEPTKTKAQYINNSKMLTSPETLNTKNNQLKLLKNTPPPAELNSANLNKNLNSLNLNFSNSMLSKHHPRPSAVTSFNARLTDNGGGHTLWNRKQDNLRLILSNAFSQTSNFLDRNRCFTPNNAGAITDSFNGYNFKDQINTQKDNSNSLTANQPTSSLHCHRQFHNDEIQSENPNEISYSRFEGFIQNTKVNSEKLIKKRGISNTQTDLLQQSFLNQTTNYLDDNQKPKLKKTGNAHDELSNLQPPSAKLAKLNQEKSTLVSLITSNNKNFNQINTKKTLNLNLKSSFDGINHSERNQLNSIEISKTTNTAGLASYSNHSNIQNDRLLTNLNSKECQKQQKQHQHSTANDITAAAYRKYPLSASSFISFKNPMNNSKTLNSFLQNEDVDENDDDIVEITPMTKNYNLSKINSTSVISTSNESNFHFMQTSDINDDNLSKNIACNNRQQKKSVSLSPSPSSSSSSSTISSINLNSANGNTACLLNTIN